MNLMRGGVRYLKKNKPPLLSLWACLSAWGRLCRFHIAVPCMAHATGICENYEPSVTGIPYALCTLLIHGGSQYSLSVETKQGIIVGMMYLC